MEDDTTINDIEKQLKVTGPGKCTSHWCKHSCHQLKTIETSHQYCTSKHRENVSIPHACHVQANKKYKYDGPKNGRHGTTHPDNSSYL